MPNRRLIQLLVVIAFLNVLHLFDHILRGDFHWPIDEQSVGFGGETAILWRNVLSKR